MTQLDHTSAGAETVEDASLPIKVLQFGEGNFLRAFMDWMIHEMNQKGRFNGRVSIVQPIDHGMVDVLNAQDCLYTVLLRGIRNGERVVEREIIRSVGHAINPYTQFPEYLKGAENPDLRIIVSNTTEAGIELRKDDRPDLEPAISFPGKLLQLMKRRYDVFGGDADKGLLIFPCELIEQNGSTLKRVLVELAANWYPDDPDFFNWLTTANVFFNTLVDRIVSGYPKDEAEALGEEFGYDDKLIVAGEIFHFLAIEGPAEYEPEFPVVSAGFNVKWCDDLTPYRTRKVRILNGAHTMTVLAAHLYGLETVKECMDDPVVSTYVRKGLFEEIIPTLDLPREELEEFASAVLERFGNPFVRHLLLSISLNSVSKFKTRVLPSLLEYHERQGKVPEVLSFSLAALILFYRGKERAEVSLSAVRDLDGAAYDVNDSPEVLDWFFDLWQQELSADDRVRRVLAKTEYWECDLNEVPSLCETVATYLEAMISDGVPAVLKRVAQ